MNKTQENIYHLYFSYKFLHDINIVSIKDIAIKLIKRVFIYSILNTKEDITTKQNINREQFWKCLVILYIKQ